MGKNHSYAGGQRRFPPLCHFPMLGCIGSRMGIDRCCSQFLFSPAHIVGTVLNAALYEKMATEQEKYRDWLKSQPPEEILHHTYEYTVREDIVMAMEELELTDAQAQALLESPSPLSARFSMLSRITSI